MEEKLFTRHRSKIANQLIKLFADDKNVYSLNVTKYDIRLQGFYNPKTVKELVKKGFKFDSSEQGYLYLSKTIAGISLVFIFTD